MSRITPRVHKCVLIILPGYAKIQYQYCSPQISDETRMQDNSTKLQRMRPDMLLKVKKEVKK